MLDPHVGSDGVNVSLSAATTPSIKAYFSPTPQALGQNPVDSPTLVFVEGGDAPLVSIVANTDNKLAFEPYCYLAGYTVTLP